MNRIVSVLFLSVFLALASVPATGHGQEKGRKTFLSVLKEGQSISVKEVAGRYEITLLKDVKLGHKVIEVGAEYVVVEDAAGITETRIPVYSIKSIVKLKVPRE